jgi:hypothetical protein
VKPNTRRLFLLILIFLCNAATATAGEDYFMLMFGSQRIPANPNYSHTWATFVRVTWKGDGPCPVDASLDVQSISWLPANMKVRTSALFPECGHNFDLIQTLDFAYGTDQRVSLWGPYRIQPELFERAMRRKLNLESGAIRYKANDVGYRSDNVANCIHGVSTIAEGPKLRVASPGWGESASYFVLQEMEPWIISKETEPWVGSAIGLDQHPIIYRDYTNPRSNAVFGPLLRVLGSERNLKATYGPPIRP